MNYDLTPNVSVRLAECCLPESTILGHFSLSSNENLETLAEGPGFNPVHFFQKQMRWLPGFYQM